MAKHGPTLTRRNALARLGLVATAVYAAPLVTRLDSARAAFPSGCGGGPGIGLGQGGGVGQGGGGGCGGGTGNNPNNNPNSNAFKKK
ncbi:MULTISPECIES: hypothetical protein [unclassified Minwuia]|jgi:hypothetical protein|uniref:hypothetical protein n=1 Tax=unclassified Minwuia TaxID=2618799 RepID=UPI0024791BF8|nr:MULTISPECIES: hypothetical protein [unclassified Minwuia]